MTTKQQAQHDYYTAAGTEHQHPMTKEDIRAQYEAAGAPALATRTTTGTGAKIIIAALVWVALIVGLLIVLSQFA